MACGVDVCSPAPPRCAEDMPISPEAQSLTTGVEDANLFSSAAPSQDRGRVSVHSKLFRSKRVNPSVVAQDVSLICRLDGDTQSKILSVIRRLFDQETVNPSTVVSDLTEDIDLTREEVERIVAITDFFVRPILEEGDSIEAIIEDLQEIKALDSDDESRLAGFLEKVRASIPDDWRDDERRRKVARRGPPYLSRIITTANLRGISERGSPGTLIDYVPVGVLTVLGDTYGEEQAEFTFQVDRNRLRYMIERLQRLQRELDALREVGDTAQAATAGKRDSVER